MQYFKITKVMFYKLYTITTLQNIENGFFNSLGRLKILCNILLISITFF